VRLRSLRTIRRNPRACFFAKSPNTSDVSLESSSAVYYKYIIHEYVFREAIYKRLYSICIPISQVLSSLMCIAVRRFFQFAKLLLFLRLNTMPFTPSVSYISLPQCASLSHRVMIYVCLGTKNL
jgi:hypothetical protein